MIVKTLLLGAVVLSMGSGAARAAVLHEFGPAPDGLNASSPLLADKSGSGGFFGSTYTGGAFGQGTIYRLIPGVAGMPATYETIFSFPGAAGGAEPLHALAQDASGALYGVTYAGGSSNLSLCPSYVAGCGLVYRLNPPAQAQGAWTETVLANAVDISPGSIPSGGPLLGPDGTLYGNLSGIAAPPYDGAVYRLTPPATGSGTWTPSVLYAFTGGSDGFWPYGSLVMGLPNTLFGVTELGGPKTTFCTQPPGCGTAFRLIPPASGATAWKHELLYAFGSQANDGFEPVTGLIVGPGHLLYGTTNYGGSTSGYTNGIVFSLAPPVTPTGAWVKTTLYAFAGLPDGSAPSALVAAGAEMLLGATFGGGHASCNYGNGCGTVFTLSRNAAGTWSESGEYSLNKTTGWDPIGVTIGKKNTVYVTTAAGGQYRSGTVQRLQLH